MKTEKAKKAFRKRLDALESIFDFIHAFLKNNHIDEKFCFPIDLAVEELFTNMIKYNSESQQDIILSLHHHGKRLVMSITDHDVEAFDITKAGDVDTSKVLADRKVGGLGLHLARKMVDEVSYEYSDRRSKIILTKNLEN